MSVYPAIWRTPRPAIGPAIWRNAGEVALVTPGVLRSPMVLTRAQASGAMSTAQGADGVTWAEYAADVARFHGAARRLMIEGQRTDSLANSRCEGAVVGTVGSGGSLPTGWSPSGSGTIVVLGSGVEDGLSYVDLDVSGSAPFAIDFSASVPATNTDVWAVAFNCKLLTTGGSLANVTTQAAFLAIGGGTVTTGTAAFVPTTAALGSQRQRHSSGLSGVISGIRGRARFAPSAAYQVRLRIAAPQLELGGFASSPIFPAVGTPASSTRGADLASASLAALGISGPFTVLWSGMLPQNAVGTNQTLFQADAGADTNRVMLRNVAGGATVVAGRTTSSSTVDATSLGSITAGTPFGAGATYDPATGRLAACIGGGTVQAVTGGPTGLTTLRLGNNAAGAAPMCGETGTFLVLPRAMTDAELAAAVAALPL